MACFVKEIGIMPSSTPQVVLVIAISTCLVQCVKGNPLPSNPELSTILSCDDGYFVQKLNSLDPETARCRHCTNCTYIKHTPYQTRVCSKYFDTLCCSSSDMVARLTKHGYYECHQPKTINSSTGSTLSCDDGHFIQVVSSLDPDTSRCRPCTNCTYTKQTPYQKLNCSEHFDTLCCARPDMEARFTEHGYYECHRPVDSTMFTSTTPVPTTTTATTTTTTPPSPDPTTHKVFEEYKDDDGHVEMESGNDNLVCENGKHAQKQGGRFVCESNVMAPTPAPNSFLIGGIVFAIKGFGILMVIIGFALLFVMQVNLRPTQPNQQEVQINLERQNSTESSRSLEIQGPVDGSDPTKDV